MAVLPAAIKETAVTAQIPPEDRSTQLGSAHPLSFSQGRCFCVILSAAKDLARPRRPFTISKESRVSSTLTFEDLDLSQSLLCFLFRHRFRQPFALLTKHHVFVADFPNHGSSLIEAEKILREPQKPEQSRDLSPMLQPALAQKKN